MRVDVNDRQGDHLIGGSGNDVYLVNHAGDATVEHNGGGHDLVEASVSYKLHWHSQYTEDLTLIGWGDIFAVGNNLDNTLTGNRGDNLLNGARGNDTLSGGEGADTFKFSSTFGNDTILDFDPSEAGERIDLVQVSSITSYADLTARHVTTDGNDLLIHDNAGNSVRLIDIALSDLSASHFQF